MADRADFKVKPNHNSLMKQSDKLRFVDWHLLKLVDFKDWQDEDTGELNKEEENYLKKIDKKNSYFRPFKYFTGSPRIISKKS